MVESHSDLLWPCKHIPIDREMLVNPEVGIHMKNLMEGLIRSSYFLKYTSVGAGLRVHPFHLLPTET